MGKPSKPKTISPAKIKDWVSRLVAVKTELEQIAPGTDVQLAQHKGSLVAQLEAVQAEIEAAL